MSDVRAITHSVFTSGPVCFTACPPLLNPPPSDRLPRSTRRSGPCGSGRAGHSASNSARSTSAWSRSGPRPSRSRPGRPDRPVTGLGIVTAATGHPRPNGCPSRTVLCYGIVHFVGGSLSRRVPHPAVTLLGQTGGLLFATGPRSSCPPTTSPAPTCSGRDGAHRHDHAHRAATGRRPLRPVRCPPSRRPARCSRLAADRPHGSRTVVRVRRWHPSRPRGDGRTPGRPRPRRPARTRLLTADRRAAGSRPGDGAPDGGLTRPQPRPAQPHVAE